MGITGNIENNLLIFDIDGTLLYSKEDKNDDILFLKALKDLFNIINVNSNWEDYKYSVDYGLITEIFNTHLNREPNKDDLQKLADYYYELQSKAKFDPIKGALTFFAKARTKCKIAVATGNLYKVAIIKLQKAGFNDFNFPIIGCDGLKERSEIIHTAIESSKDFYKQKNFSTITYFGDRIFDYEATKRLNIKFIGIGKNQKMRQNAGTYHDDFSEIVI